MQQLSFNSREFADRTKPEVLLETTLLGNDIPIVFLLPDKATEWNMTFKEGHTVAFLKAALEKEFGIPFNVQSLLYNGRVLADPFSLSDIPMKVGQVNQINVSLM